MDVSPDGTTRKWPNRHSDSGRLTPGAALLLQLTTAVGRWRSWLCVSPGVGPESGALASPGSCWLFLL